MTLLTFASAFAEPSNIGSLVGALVGSFLAHARSGKRLKRVEKKTDRLEMEVSALSRDMRLIRREILGVYTNPGIVIDDRAEKAPKADPDEDTKP